MIRKAFPLSLIAQLIALILVSSTSLICFQPRASCDESSFHKMGIANEGFEDQPEIYSDSDKAVSSPSSSNTESMADRKAIESYGKLPLSFEANYGQTDSKVRYLSRTRGFNVFLTSNEAVIALSQQNHRNRSGKPLNRDVTQNRGASKTNIFRAKLVGANDKPLLTGVDRLPGKTNYYLGGAANDWKTNIPNYSKVKYEAVYPGIDLIYYGNQQQLEYDFVVAPGADPSSIKFHFDGARKIRMHPNGDLVLSVGRHEIHQHKPVAYQEINGVRQTVTCRQKIINKKVVGFELGSYDSTRPLVIDPILRYSTYYGGSDNEWADSIAIDSSGNIYITGNTVSTNFPTQSALQPTISIPNDAFVVKLNPAGSSIIYSTYLGGNSGDRGRCIIVDASGNAYIGGETDSTNFPVLNAVQATYGGGFNEGFITKLSSSGSLSYSTYVGGNGWDAVRSLARDATGNLYMTGETESTNFPATNSLPANLRGVFNIFVAKLNAAGSSFAYIAAFGRSTSSEPASIAIDSSGNAYVTGFTQATDFPTSSPFQAAYGGGSHDTFVTKLNSTGSSFVYSTFLGGTSWDFGKAITVDGSGNAYVTGYTNSNNYPTVNPVQATRSGNTNDVFITKFNSSGSALVYSTYLGGDGSDIGQAIALDSTGAVCIVGSTSSSDLPTVNPLQSTFGGGSDDVLVAKLNPAGSALIHCTYFGGSGEDIGFGIAVDSANNIYATGRTRSSNYPTLNPIQSAGGFDDAFILKIGETYKISGRVMSNGGAGISGVTVSLSGAQTGTTETDEDGDYSFENLGSGDNFTVTPSSPIYHFSPASRTFNNLVGNETADFVTINVYTISGRIASAGGSGISAVTVTLTGSQTGSTITDTGGNYSFTELAEGGTYTITPSSLNYVFSPPSQTLTNLSGHQSANFTATLTYVISGQVTDSGGNGVGAVTMTLSGSSSATVQTNASGVYAFGNLAPGGNYTITPSKTGYTFSPVNQSFTNLNADKNASFVVTGVINPPQINNLSPTSGQVGTSVTISGSNFGATQGASVVTFNGITATPSSWSSTSIVVAVPAGAATGAVVVTANGMSSNGVSFTVTSPAQTTTYYLHKEMSITTGANQLKVMGPDSALQAIQSVDLKSKATGEYVINTFDTQADVPNASKVLPTGTTITFNLWMRKTANFGTMFPRAKLLLNTATGTSVCTVTGTTALTTTITKYTLTGTTTAPITLTTTDRLFLWVGVNLTAGNSANTFKGELNIEGTLNGNYDSNIVVPLPVQPTISSISPAFGAIGATVIVTGSNFGPIQGTSTIKFNGTAATPSSWNDGAITAPVPAGATTGPLVVSVNGMSSNGVVFTVGSPAQTTVYHVHKEASPTSGTSQLKTAGPDSTIQAVQSVDLKAKTAGEYIISAYDTQYNVPNGVIPSGSTITFTLWMRKSANFGTMFPRAKLYLNNSSGALLCTVTGTTALNTTITKYTLTGTTSAAATLTTGDRFYLWVGINLTATNGSNTFKGELNIEGTLNGNYDSNIAVPIPLPQPVISNVSPNVGPIGSAITITGAKFGAAQGTSTIKFNGTTATPGSWSDTVIVANVPASATTGPVIVTVSGVASNGAAFTVGSSAGDLDGDGLPDSWETQYFGSLNQTANGDFDGDGLSNFLEYLLGRNPTKGAIADTNAAVNLKLFTPLEP